MNMVPLGDICEFKYGKSLPKKVRESGPFSVFGSNGQVDEHSEAYTDGPTIIVGRKGSIGEVAFSDGPCWPIDTTYYVDSTATAQNPRWLFYALKSLRLQQLNKSAAIPGLNRNDAYAKKISLPPLEEQKRIAGILDQADALRRLRTRALDKLGTLGQAIFHEMFGDVRDESVKRLTEVAELINGDRSSNYPSGDDLKDDGVLFLSTKNIRNWRLVLDKVLHITEEKFASLSRGKLQRGDLVITLRGTLGQAAIFDCEFERRR